MKDVKEFMSYLHNFTLDSDTMLPSVFKCFAHDNNLYNHLVDKYNSIQGKSGTQALFEFYYQLSDNNKDLFIAWIVCPKKNSVKASKFIEWFCDNDFSRESGWEVSKSLKVTGKYSLTAKELFDSCGYIPLSICEHDVDNSTDGEYDPNEVEFINDL